MALIVDAGALFAYSDGREVRHDAVVRIMRAEREPLVTTELAIAEADYLILGRLGIDAELAVLDDLAAGTFTVDCLSLAELGMARTIVRQYRDLRLGLADASLVVLALRYGSNRILTFDERAFRRVTPLQGGHFVVLPADSPVR
ncbi:MAG: PIN domain-containing protein [Dehalococcoidia bacterium]